MTKQLLLTTLLLLVTAVCAFAQDQTQPPVAANSTIESVEVSGLVEFRIEDENINISLSSSSQRRLSQGLRDELQKLKDQTYDPELAAQLADRIQDEMPEYVAAVRTSPGSQAGRVRVIFVVAPASDKDVLGENINSKYPVESVQLEGIDRSQISATLWTEMQKMVGQPLNNDEAERHLKSIQSELGSRYVVTRRVKRGNQARQLTLIFEIAKTPMIRWDSPRSLFAYHPKQGVTAFPHVSFGETTGDEGQLRFGGGTNGDELIERYKGFRLQYERHNLGSERLAFRVIASTFGAKWKSQTLLASEQSLDGPRVYRSRNFVEPELAFAITPDLHITAGLNATELSMLFPESHSESSRSAIGSIEYQFRGNTHNIFANYNVRSGRDLLGSDFLYTRHSWEGRYLFRHDSSFIRLDVRGGRISGNAPLFERFSIGNTETARGWNKFDIAPLGGLRTFHGTLEIGWTDIRPFYDAGAVWDPGQPIKVHQSIGLTFGAGDHRGEGFLTIAAAFRNSRLEPSIMLRFGGR